MKLFTLIVLMMSMFLKKLKDLLDIKTQKQTFRIQADDSIMCGYFCTGFINFMFAGRSLIDFTGLFSPYDFKKNDKIILNYFELANFSHI